MAKKRVTKKTNGKSVSRGNTVKIVVEQKGQRGKRRTRFLGVVLKIAAVAIVALLAVWGLSQCGVFDKLPSNGCAGIEIPGLKGCANKKTNPNKDDPNADSGVTDPDEEQKDDASNGGVTITFNANGGTLTGAATMKTGKDGKLAELPSEPTREGYTFIGWTLSKYDVLTSNGNRQGVIYEETVFLKNQTVYAYWADPIRVTFEPVVTANGTVFDGAVFNLIGTDTFNIDLYKDLWPADPVRDGYTFNGWTDTAGTVYTVESTFADDTTLRAKFSRLPGAYEITFNAKGGTFTGAYRIMTGDDGIVADWPDDPTHETLYFHGWSVNRDGDGGLVSSSTVFDADTVLYAVWDEEPPEQLPDEGGNETGDGEIGGGNEGDDETGEGGNTGTDGDNTGTDEGGENKPDDGTDEGDDNTGTDEGGEGGDGTGTGGESGVPDDGTDEGGDNTETGGGDTGTDEGGDTGTGGSGSSIVGPSSNTPSWDPLAEDYIAEFDKSEGMDGAEVTVSLPEQMVELSETVGVSAAYMGHESISIADGAFKGRTGMKYLYLHDDVISVGVGAFADCSDLEEVTIMNPHITIHDSAFGGCEKLTAIYFNGTWADIVALFNSGAWDFNSFAATPDDCIIYLMQGTGAENDPTAISILSIRNDGYLVEYTPETETEGSESINE